VFCPKKVFTFYAELLMQRSLEMSPWFMPSALRSLTHHW